MSATKPLGECLSRETHLLGEFGHRGVTRDFVVAVVEGSIQYILLRSCESESRLSALDRRIDPADVTVDVLLLAVLVGPRDGVPGREQQPEEPSVGGSVCREDCPILLNEYFHERIDFLHSLHSVQAFVAEVEKKCSLIDGVVRFKHVFDCH